MQIKSNKAFTLVELIVVITILSILWTIGFMSFQSYNVFARDSVRITDIKQMQSVLEYSYTETGLYPKPDWENNITYSWSVAWIQWEFWKETVRKTKRLNSIPTDPLIENNYAYSVTQNGWEFEIGWIFEWDEVWFNSDIVKSSYADTSGFKAYIWWNYNGKILKVSTGSVDYILAVPSILTTTILINTVENIILTNSFSIKWTKNLPKTYWWASLETKKFVDENNYIVFEWDLDDLKEDENLQEEITTKLVTAYSWSLTAEKNSDIQNLVDTPISNNLFVAQSLLKTTVLKKMSITSSNASVTPPITDWRSKDPNCTIPDITIWSQTWAGCNSTIWTWVEYTWNWPCYSYSNTNIWWTSCYWFDTAESSYNSTYWIDNVWWKLYTWDNSDSACTTWYHVPSDLEWESLEIILNWWVNCRNVTNWWLCDWLGWKNHTSKTSSNNMIESLKLPLSGNQHTDGSTFYLRGYNTHLWSSTPNGGSAYSRHLRWDLSTVNRNYWSKAYSFSVRCIKD